MLVEVSIVDKVFPCYLVDRGSALNIISWSIMKKLGQHHHGRSTMAQIIYGESSCNLKNEEVYKYEEVCKQTGCHELDMMMRKP